MGGRPPLKTEIRIAKTDSEPAEQQGNIPIKVNCTYVISSENCMGAFVLTIRYEDMKYSIFINQFCWEKNNLTSLDIVDLALFDAIKSFVLSEKAETITFERQVYYWISPSLLIETMPILGITTARGINKRIDNLIEAKLLERCPNNQSIKRTYFRMGENYNKYECYNGNENSSLGTSVPTRTWNENSNNNNINNDNNIIIKETIVNNSKEKEPKVKFAEFVSMTSTEYEKLKAELGEKGANECIEILNNYKGSKGKTYKNDYLAIRSWVIDRLNEKQQQYPSPNKPATPSPSQLPKWKAMGFKSEEEYLNRNKR